MNRINYKLIAARYAQTLRDIQARMRIHVHGFDLSSGNKDFLPTRGQCQLVAEIISEALNYVPDTTPKSRKVHPRALRQ